MTAAVLAVAALLLVGAVTLLLMTARTASPVPVSCPAVATCVPAEQGATSARHPAPSQY